MPMAKSLKRKQKKVCDCVKPVPKGGGNFDVLITTSDGNGFVPNPNCEDCDGSGYKKHQSGRPGKTLEDLNKIAQTHAIEDSNGRYYQSFSELIQNEMSHGASLTEIKAMLRLWNDTYERLLEEEPEFKEAIKRGLLCSESWWLKEGRSNLKNREFSYTGWYMNMKNRFGWKDKQELEHQGNPDKPIEHNHNFNPQTMTDDELNRWMAARKKN
jgi:hypothetical protein